GVTNALAVSGNTIYAGGDFALIGGQPRNALAALDATTGACMAWNPSTGDAAAAVQALAIASGLIYAGGSFVTMGGEQRGGLAALDSTTGAATAWNPGVDGIVWSLAASANTIYVGGYFSKLGGVPRAGFAGISMPPPGHSTGSSGPLLLTLAPNPVHSCGVLSFTLPAAARASMAVYDLQGRRVAMLLDRVPQLAGQHQVPLQT